MLIQKQYSKLISQEISNMLRIQTVFFIDEEVKEINPDFSQGAIKKNMRSADLFGIDIK